MESRDFDRRPGGSILGEFTQHGSLGMGLAGVRDGGILEGRRAQRADGGVTERVCVGPHFAAGANFWRAEGSPPRVGCLGRGAYHPSIHCAESLVPTRYQSQSHPH